MKANFDIELAIDILTMSDRLDVVVLMSGDGDFRRLVELIASRGVRVEVVAFSETASSELKTVADLYVDIGAHLDDFKVRPLASARLLVTGRRHHVMDRAVVVERPCGVERALVGPTLPQCVAGEHARVLGHVVRQVALEEPRHRRALP